VWKHHCVRIHVSYALPTCVTGPAIQAGTANAVALGAAETADTRSVAEAAAVGTVAAANAQPGPLTLTAAAEAGAQGQKAAMQAFPNSDKNTRAANAGAAGAAVALLRMRGGTLFDHKNCEILTLSTTQSMQCFTIYFDQDIDHHHHLGYSLLSLQLSVQSRLADEILL
jgi:hypothetical protein